MQKSLQTFWQPLLSYSHNSTLTFGSSEPGVLSQELSCIWPCLEIFLIVSTERVRLGWVLLVRWAEARDAMKHPAMYRTAAPLCPTKNYRGRVNTAEVENTCSIPIDYLRFLSSPLPQEEGDRKPMCLFFLCYRLAQSFKFKAKATQPIQCHLLEVRIIQKQ